VLSVLKSIRESNIVNPCGFDILAEV